MKKVKFLALMLVACLVLSMTAFAAEPNTDTLEDWGITVTVPDGCSSALFEEQGEYYIYPEIEGSIPYVMIYYYDGFDDEEDVVNGFFIDMMSEHYDDLEVTSGLSRIDIDGEDYYEIDFSYTVEGYEVTDRRILKEIDGRVYMFASKEIDELGLSVGTLLEDTVATCEFFGEDTEDPEDELGSAERTIEWEDVIDLIDGAEESGRFETIEDLGLELFIPNEYETMELPEEYLNMYYIAYFTTDEETWVPGISVQYVDTMDLHSMEEYIDYIKNLGPMEIIDEGEINGIPCLVYDFPYNNSIVVGTVVNDGIMEISMSAVDDGMSPEEQLLVMASLRKIADEEDTGAFINAGITDGALDAGADALGDSTFVASGVAGNIILDDIAADTENEDDAAVEIIAEENAADEDAALYGTIGEVSTDDIIEDSVADESEGDTNLSSQLMDVLEQLSGFFGKQHKR